MSFGTESADRTITRDEIVVLASGNLGLISFTKWPERMTLQEIVAAFPQLFGGLTSHPGIGLVLVNDEQEGGIVLGKSGICYLESGTVDGENPLAPYGELAARHLRRTNAFPARPDVLVISTYWQDENEIAAFEELVGSHGGLGGDQRHSFVFHPVRFEAGDDLIVGAGELNSVLHSWFASATEAEIAMEPEQEEPAMFIQPNPAGP